MLDAKQVPVDVISCTVNPNVTEQNTGVCGETRDRLWKETNFYEVSVECKQTALETLIPLLEDQENDDAMALPKNKVIAISIKPNDGTMTNFMLSGDVTVSWNMGAPGRTEQNTMTLSIRAQYFEKIGS